MDELLIHTNQKALVTSDIITYFLQDCRARGLRPRTLEFYQENLRNLPEVAPTIGDMTLLVANRLLIAATERGIKPISVHAIYRTLKAFSNWVYNQELVPAPPLAKLRPPKVDSEQKSPPTDKTILELLNTCGKELLDLRDRAIILFLLDTGCRMGELVGLTRDAIEGNIVLHETKGRRDRYVFITSKTRMMLIRYMASRPDHSNSLFVDRYDDPMTSNAIRLMFQRRCKMAHIHISPHMLRRAAATAWVESGANLEVVRQLLGHASLATTQKYLGIRPEVLQQVHETVSWTHRLKR